MKQLKDITQELTETQEAPNLASDDVRKMYYDRVEMAKRLLREEPDKTVFDIAITCLLPVPTVQGLKAGEDIESIVSRGDDIGGI